MTAAFAMNNYIITGQNVRVETRQAVFMLRLLSGLIDLLVMFAIIWLSAAYMIPLVEAFGEFAVFVIVIAIMMYPFITEVLFHGQTFGKMALKLKVVRVEGEAPSVGDFFLRWALQPVDYLLLPPVTLCLFVFSDRSQRLGDMASGTMVIRTERSANRMVRLNDFYTVQVGYVPVYPLAQNLTEGQAEIIHTVLTSYSQSTNQQINSLAQKVVPICGPPPSSNIYTGQYLTQVWRDYQYFASRRK